MPFIMLFRKVPLVIRYNDNLTSLTGLKNIDPYSITDLYIYNNNSLSTCEVKSICDYLSNPNGTIDIHNNASGCNSQTEVETACASSVESINFEDEFSIFPNPVKNTLKIPINNGATIENIVIYNQIGQKVQQGKPVNNTINISKLQQGMYIVEVESNEWKIRTKLIIE